jgi:hypothetical protein
VHDYMAKCVNSELRVSSAKIPNSVLLVLACMGGNALTKEC